MSCDARHLGAVTRGRYAGLGCAPVSLLTRTIDAQPDVLAAVLEIDLRRAAATLADTDRLWLVGTGTSQHAAELAALLLGTPARPAHACSAAWFCGCGPTPAPGDGVVVISHTGHTAYARRARQRAADAGAALVSITGAGCDWPEAVHTGPAERSETYTASYTAALLTLARLGLVLGARGYDEHELARLPRLLHAGEPGLDPPLDAAPERLVVIVGAGPFAVTAREGALKLREAAHLPAEGFESEYLLHGSAVPLDARDALVVLEPAADRDGLTARVAAAAATAGVHVHTVTAGYRGHPVLAQLPLTVALQRLAARLAETAGTDPDTVIVGGWDDDALWEAGAPPAAN